LVGEEGDIVEISCMVGEEGITADVSCVSMVRECDTLADVSCETVGGEDMLVD
jgi:hypothetical protein